MRNQKQNKNTTKTQRSSLFQAIYAKLHVKYQHIMKTSFLEQINDQVLNKYGTRCS